MNDQESMNCPVCGALVKIGDTCPVCGFEPHFFSNVPSERIRTIEQARIEAAKKIWEELSELRNKKSMGSKPCGFLITERLVVYCLYEGLNTFGSSPEASEENESVQSVLMSGIQIMPRHFQIKVERSEDGKKTAFSIRNLAGEGVKVFLNTLTLQIAGDFEEIRSGDTVLFSNDSREVSAELKFRKNL